MSPRGVQELQVEPKKGSRRAQEAPSWTQEAAQEVSKRVKVSPQGAHEHPKSCLKAVLEHVNDKIVRTSKIEDSTALLRVFQCLGALRKGNWRASWRSFWLFGGQVGAPKAILEPKSGVQGTKRCPRGSKLRPRSA